jgi:hypothetical protein
MLGYEPRLVETMRRPSAQTGTLAFDVRRFPNAPPISSTNYRCSPLDKDECLARDQECLWQSIGVCTVNEEAWREVYRESERLADVAKFNQQAAQEAADSAAQVESKQKNRRLSVSARFTPTPPTSRPPSPLLMINTDSRSRTPSPPPLPMMEPFVRTTGRISPFDKLVMLSKLF